MIITLTGVPGSGKTTAAKALSAALGVPWYSIGDLRGKMAQERGLTIDQLNALGEKEAFTDRDIDDYQAKIGERGEDCIVEGRLSWHFIPSSFKVFLDADPAVAGERIYRAQLTHRRTDEPVYGSAKEAADTMAARVASDVRRYQKYYGVDFHDHANYDLVIDTTRVPPEETAARILEAVRRKAGA